jgi:hypothetical protein
LTAAREGQDLTPYKDALEKATNTLGQDSKGLYSEYTDFARDQARTAARLRELKDLTDSEKSTAEKTLETLDKTYQDELKRLDAILKAFDDEVKVLRGIDISVVDVATAVTRVRGVLDGIDKDFDKTYKAEIERLDKLVEGYDKQVKLLNGTDDGPLKSIAEATKDLDEAIAAFDNKADINLVEDAVWAVERAIRELGGLGATRRPGGVNANTLPGFTDDVRTPPPATSSGYTAGQINTAVMGHLNTGGSLMDVYGAAQTYGVSSTELASALGISHSDVVSWVAANNLPMFADGGLHTGGIRLVGEEGPELEITGPARYFDARTTDRMLNGGSQEGDSEELTLLRMELQMMRAELQATARHTAKTAKILERVTPDGDSIQTRETVD